MTVLLALPLAFAALFCCVFVATLLVTLVAASKTGTAAPQPDGRRPADR